MPHQLPLRQAQPHLVDHIAQRGAPLLTIATWNLENLFRPGEDAGPEADAAYQAKLQALAETITDLTPDVLAVQEVGEPEALADLVDRLAGTWHTALG